MSNTDFSVGHWRHKVNVYHKGKPKPIPSPLGNGDEFAKQNPELFLGCGCKKDIVPIINRWTSPTDQQIETVAKTLHNKNKKIPLEDIIAILNEFAASLND